MEGDAAIENYLNSSPVNPEKTLAEAGASASELLNLWNDKCATRGMPAWTEFSVDEFRSKLGDINLLEVVEGGADFRFRVYGTRIAEAMGYDMTGKTVSDLPNSALVDISHSLYRKVVASRKPWAVFHRATTAPAKKFWLRLALPLSDDGDTVDRILGYGQPIVPGAAEALSNDQFASKIVWFEARPGDPAFVVDDLTEAYLNLIGVACTKKSA